MTSSPNQAFFLSLLEIVGLEGKQSGCELVLFYLMTTMTQEHLSLFVQLAQIFCYHFPSCLEGALSLMIQKLPHLEPKTCESFLKFLNSLLLLEDLK